MSVVEKWVVDLLNNCYAVLFVSHSLTLKSVVLASTFPQQRVASVDGENGSFLKRVKYKGETNYNNGSELLLEATKRVQTENKYKENWNTIFRKIRNFRLTLI